MEAVTSPAEHPVRIAVQLQPQHADYRQIRDAVFRSEEMGIDVVFNWDHFYPLYGDPDGKHFECWTMLGAWAEQTERVEIGALVTCGGYRNPDLLADMARTVDHLSDGRLIFGIGSGWFAKDYEQYGYDFGTAGSRLDLLGEYLPRITHRWSQLNPAPTRKIPVLLGGGGERKTLRFVAEYGDIWHNFGDVATLTHKSQVLAEHCARAGRDPGEIVRSTSAPKDTAAADELRGIGFSLFTVGLGGPDYDLDQVTPWLRWRDAANG